jgi:hypothetical protein
LVQAVRDAAAMKNTLVLASVLVAAPAWALSQNAHYQISNDACRAAGGPSAFCDQVGVSAHNVDQTEFNTLSAHSHQRRQRAARLRL